MRRRFLRARVNADPVLRALKRAERRARDIRPALKEIRKPFLREQRRHFKAQEGPDGRWPPRKKATEGRALRNAQKAAQKKKRKRRPRKAPRPLGKLRQVRARLRKRELIIYSRIPWSGVHQRGGKVGRGARIPARPFLWVERPWLRRYPRPALLRHVNPFRRSR